MEPRSGAKTFQKAIGDKKSGFFSHAYAIVCDNPDSYAGDIAGFLENEFGIVRKKNPDFYEYNVERFFIEDAETLIQAVQSSAFVEGGRKIFFIITETFTREAQNKLLKTFEEPSEGTIFFLFIPSQSVLLPTVLSRFLLVTQEKETMPEDMQKLARAFLGVSKKKRLELIEDMVLKKDKRKARVFLDALESAFVAQVDVKNMQPSELYFLEEVRTARGYLKDRSPSMKMLLEHVSLSV